MKIKHYFEVPLPETLRNRNLEEFLFHGLPLLFLEQLRRFTRMSVEGVENIPSPNRAMIIANHSGYTGMDAMMLGFEVWRHKKRFPRVMAHNFYFSNELLAFLAEKLCMFPADFKRAVKHLKKNRLQIVFPEGEKGNFKDSTKMYQLQDFNPGFVGLSLMTNTPIVPTIIIGAEETHINLGRTDILKPLLGVSFPIPLNFLPLPARWKIKFLKPISLERYGRAALKDQALMSEISHNVRIQIQREINRELVKRGTLPY